VRLPRIWWPQICGLQFLFFSYAFFTFAPGLGLLRDGLAIMCRLFFGRCFFRRLLGEVPARIFARISFALRGVA